MEHSKKTGMPTRLEDALIKKIHDKSGEWITVKDQFPTRAASENLLRTIKNMLDKCMTDELKRQEIERLKEELKDLKGEDGTNPNQ